MKMKMLLYMAEGRTGRSAVFKVLEDTGVFPIMWSAWQNWDRKQVLWIR